MIPPDAVKSHFDKGLFIPADSDWKEEEKDQTEFVSAYPAILTNAGSHIRIFGTCGGFCLEGIWKRIAPFERALSEKVSFAFHPEFGYLSERLDGIGTSLTVSAMVHLPAICLSGKEKTLLRGLEALRFGAVSFMNRKNEFPGALFLIYNECSLGESEEDLILRFIKVIQAVVREERLLRRRMLEKQKEMLENICGRAYGLLRYSHLISPEEALTALSPLKLGMDTGIIRGVEKNTFYKMLIRILPGHTRFYAERECGKRGISGEGEKSEDEGAEKKISAADCSGIRAAWIRAAVSGTEDCPAGPVTE